MLTTAFYDTKPYDRQSFSRASGAESIQWRFHEFRLTAETAATAQDAEAVCVFVNDRVNQPCLEALAKLGVRLVALRCAGFNNVDLGAAKFLGIALTRVPAYSPHAVAEHTVGLLLALNRKIHRAYNRVRELNFSLNGLLIGGNGTFRGAIDLARVWKGKLVGVPGTIDNDLFGTDFTLGFDTAVNTAVQAIDKVRDTADAHDRVFLIEVMGRHAGHIAIAVGFATGAEQILIPEKAANVHTICQRLCAGRSRGKTSSIVVVAEGAVKGGACTIADQLRRSSRNECRVCILGHIQRGGSPTAADRLLGTKLGGYAVDLLARGQTGVMAGEVGGKLVATPLRAAIQHKKKLDHDLLKFHSKLSL